ncbi:MAG: hypothetical protein GY820_21035, partial [Gammaproteobacteria bacterium]|nr:hypothetical protein [Gammaproteobacteria bacterium]
STSGVKLRETQCEITKIERVILYRYKIGQDVSPVYYTVYTGRIPSLVGSRFAVRLRKPSESD